MEIEQFIWPEGKVYNSKCIKYCIISQAMRVARGDVQGVRLVIPLGNVDILATKLILHEMQEKMSFDLCTQIRRKSIIFYITNPHSKL